MKIHYLLILMMILVCSCKSPEARRPVTYSSGTFIKESAARNKILFEKERQAIQKIIASRTTDSFETSNNGFWYSYNTKIDSIAVKPDFGDILSFDYDVKDLSGNVIYSKEELKTQNYIMDKEELFSGLREGLKLMKAGETVTFIFPSDLAFGYYGDENKIGTNIPLICEVTLNSIIPNTTN